jgi:hypothetical protein
MTKLHVLALALLFLAAPSAAPVAASPAAVPTDCGIEIESWLTDTQFNRLCPAEFKVLTRDGCVITTNPGGFYYNILVTALEDNPDLEVTGTIPADFSLWGHNPVHVYINDFDVTGPDDADAVFAGDDLSFGPIAVAAGTRIFITIHVRYSLGCLPSVSYLPKVYTFWATATGHETVVNSSASMTGVLKN